MFTLSKFTKNHS